MELIKKVINQGEKCNRKPLYFYNDYSYQKEIHNVACMRFIL